MLYYELIKAPVSKPDTLQRGIGRRVGLFLLGDWAPLFGDLKFRSTSRSTDNRPTPLTNDPDDIRALRAQHHLERNHFRSGASKALRALVNPPVASPGDLTGAFRKLNPQVGSTIRNSYELAEGFPQVFRRPLRLP